MITFDAPFVLALAPLVGGGVWFGAAWARRVRIRRAALWSEATAALARAAGRGGPTALSVAAFLGTIALAGPRWGRETVVTESRGLNLVIAVDISRSMLAEDTRPSRLGRALREARRLVQDLEGDRIGLVAFAGSSYILSPLSVDGSALTLYLDALDPDVASEGGTALAPALRQGGELLRAGTDLADRVLVVFTDGEAQDSLAGVLAQARRVAAAGVHVILVAEGERGPARIPVRDGQGALQGYQKDDDGTTVETARRDDVLAAVADAAQGAQVAADLPDQAGAVRDLVASYKRARASEAHTERGRPRAWLPVLCAVALLIGQAGLRRTAALLGLALLAGAVPARGQDSSRLRSAAERAWDRGELERARVAYQQELSGHQANDTAWYNAGVAALAAGDHAAARTALAHAATSFDPDIRFRALYDLGVLALRAADADSTHREAHLADADRACREALLLRPRNPAAKWNLELAVRRRRGGSGGASNTPPPAGSGGGSGGPSGGGGGGGGSAGVGEQGGGGLTQAQADRVLASIGQEELRTRRERTGRSRRAGEPGVKDW